MGGGMLWGLIRWSSLGLLAGCVGYVVQSDQPGAQAGETRAELLVAAGPATSSELGMAAWNLRLRAGSLEVTGLDAEGNPAGTITYAMNRTTTTLNIDAQIDGSRKSFRLSRNGFEDRALVQSRPAQRWTAALSRDILVAGGIQVRGPAKVCADLVRTTTWACGSVMTACGGSEEDCLASARQCAQVALRTDRCQQGMP